MITLRYTVRVARSLGAALTHPGRPGRGRKHRSGDLLGPGRGPCHLRPRSPVARCRPALRGRPGRDTSPVRARDTAVLVDADETSWLSWNIYATEFLADTGATRIPIEDGGITGPAFFDHVRRLRRPLVNSPKGQTTPIPVSVPGEYWRGPGLQTRAPAGDYHGRDVPPSSATLRQYHPADHAGPAPVHRERRPSASERKPHARSHRRPGEQRRHQDLLRGPRRRPAR